MKTIRVVAAIIKEDNKIFATQRGYGEFEGMWEFPGGKIEPGEDVKEALVREIYEELDTEIEVGQYVDTIKFQYPNFFLSMECFFCKIIKGDLVLKEHKDGRWLDKGMLDQVDWLPADIELITKLKNLL